MQMPTPAITPLIAFLKDIDDSVLSRGCYAYHRR